MFDENAARKETQAQIDELNKLNALKQNPDAMALFEYQFKVAAQKMVYCFTSNTITDWNEFCKVRGEIIARLEPIQSVYGAEATITQLTDQLKEMFAQEV